MDRALETVAIAYLYEDARNVKMLYEFYSGIGNYGVSDRMDWLIGENRSYIKDNSGDTDNRETYILLGNVYVNALYVFEAESALKYLIDYNDTLARPVKGSELYANVVLAINSKYGIFGGRRDYNIDTFVAELQFIIENGKPCAAPKNYIMQEEGISSRQKLNQTIKKLDKELEAKNKELREQRNTYEQGNRQAKLLIAENEKYAAEIAKRDKKIAELQQSLSEMRKMLANGKGKQPNNVQGNTVSSKQAVQAVPNPNAVHIWERYGLKKTTYYKRKAEGTLPKIK